MRRVLLIAILSALAACDAGDEQQCDAPGNYSVLHTWGAGDCGLTQPVTVPFALTTDCSDSLSNGPCTRFSIDGEIPVDVTDDGGDCRLSFVVSEPADPDGVTATTSYNIRESGGDLSGSGSISLGGTANCQQQFAVGGTKN